MKLRYFAVSLFALWALKKVKVECCPQSHGLDFPISPVFSGNFRASQEYCGQDISSWRSKGVFYRGSRKLSFMEM